jgi:hypothetical protein
MHMDKLNIDRTKETYEKLSRTASQTVNIASNKFGDNKQKPVTKLRASNGEPSFDNAEYNKIRSNIKEHALKLTEG